MSGQIGETFVIDDGLPTGALSVAVAKGRVVEVAAERRPGARGATAAELESFWDHFWGRGPFLYAFDFDGLSPFQADAVREVRKVQPGETVTYGELALWLGRPRASRAVGTAMARNPFPIFFPCHRVVPKSGGVGRYGFGKEGVKAALLEWEATLGGDSGNG